MEVCQFVPKNPYSKRILTCFKIPNAVHIFWSKVHVHQKLAKVHDRKCIFMPPNVLSTPIPNLGWEIELIGPLYREVAIDPYIGRLLFSEKG